MLRPLKSLGATSAPEVNKSDAFENSGDFFGSRSDSKGSLGFWNLWGLHRLQKWLKVMLRLRKFLPRIQKLLIDSGIPKSLKKFLKGLSGREKGKTLGPKSPCFSSKNLYCVFLDAKKSPLLQNPQKRILRLLCPKKVWFDSKSPQYINSGFKKSATLFVCIQMTLQVGKDTWSDTLQHLYAQTSQFIKL